MHIYTRWTDVPPSLKTKTQLRRLGLKPNGESVAKIRAYGGTYDLYTIEDATHTRQCSPAQAEALAKARDIAKQREAERHELAETIYMLDHEWMLAGDRELAVQHAQELLGYPPYAWCILDTETTGLDDDAEAVQIGVLAGDGTVLLDTLVQARQAEMSDGARQTHHITDEQLSSAPTFAEVYPALKRAIEGKVVVIYNKEYDKRILATGYKLADLPYIPVRAYRCAMRWYAEYCGEWSDRKQDYRWQRLNGDHSAIGDCRAVLRLLHQMAQDNAAIGRTAAIQEQLEQLKARQYEIAPK